MTGFFLFGLILTGSLNSFVSRIVVPKETAIEIRHESPAVDHHDHEDESGHRQDQHPDRNDGVLQKLMHTWTADVLPLIFRIVPDFDETNPAPDLLLGREIAWSRLASQALFDIGLRAGFLWFLGLYCFHRKEVGLPVAN